MSNIDTLTAPAAQGARFRGHPDALILDCDGVLLDWIEGFQDYAQNRLGRKICDNGPDHFDLHVWLGLDNVADALDMVRDFNAGEGDYFGRLRPLPGAVDALTHFARSGRELHIITACSLDADVIAMRKANLREVFGDIFTDIHCVGMRDPKDPLLEEYIAATWVEDKLENAISGVRAGHASYLIRSSHNIAREAQVVMRGLRWVDGWHDIRACENAR